MSSASVMAQTELDKHMVLGAGAGTGKTHVLTRRYANAIALPSGTHRPAYPQSDPGRARQPCRASSPAAHGCTPGQIVAVTFTRKAAAEMRDRIRHVLQEYLWSKQVCPEPGVVHCDLTPAQLDHIRAQIPALAAAPINTFHGFCADLLRRFPIEAGVDPEFRLVEPAEARAFYDRASEKAVETLLRQNQDTDAFRALKELLREYDLSAIRSTLARLAPLTKEEWQALSNRETLDRQLSELYARHPLMGKLIVAVRAAGTEGKNEKDFDETIQRFLDSHALLFLTQAVDIPQNGNDDWKESFGLFRTIFRGQDRAGDKDLEKQIQIEHQALAVTDRLRKLVEGTAAALAFPPDMLDFDGLERKTLAMLADPDKRRLILERLDLKHVLVDEFQDTNHVQRQILYYLLDCADPDADSPTFPLHAPRLFVVGDPKQSIYRFRGGEIEVFARTRTDVAANGGITDQTLAENRRSTRSMVAFFDHLFHDSEGVFSRVADADCADYEPNYEPALTGDPPADGPKVGCYLAIHSQEAQAGHTPNAEYKDGETEESEGAKDEELPEDEAYWIAAQIQALTQPGPANPNPRFKPGDIAILRYSIRSIAEIEKQLACRNIPYYVVGSRGLLDRPEISDIFEWIRLLSRPDDDLALAACARQPCIGLTNPMLLALRQAPPDAFQWPEPSASDECPSDPGARQPCRASSPAAQGCAALPDAQPSAGSNNTWHKDISPETLAQGGSLHSRLRFLELKPGQPMADTINPILADFRARLNALEDLVGRVPAADLVREIVSRLRLRETWAGWRDTDQGERPAPAERVVANIERFIEFVDQSGADSADMAGLRDQLESAADSDEGTAEAQLLGEQDNVVRIMTIHQAKGLEFPVVFVSGIDSLHGGGGSSAILTCQGEWPCLKLTNPEQPFNLRDKKDSLSFWAGRLNHLKANAEKRRLFYVALTRAKERLFLSGAYTPKTKKEEEKTLQTVHDGASWLVQRFKLNNQPGWRDQPTFSFPAESEAGRFLYAGEPTSPPDQSRPTMTPPKSDAIKPLALKPSWRTIETVSPSHAEGIKDAPEPKFLPPGFNFAAAVPAATKKESAADYGDLVHRFLAAWDFEDATADTLMDDLTKAQFGDQDCSAPRKFLAHCVNGFRKLEWNGTRLQDVFQSALAEGRLFREWPFIHRVPGSGTGEPDRDIHGSIDVILDQADTRQIFDYKTGFQPTPHYRTQMALYQAALAAASPSGITIEHPVLLYLEATCKEQ